MHCDTKNITTITSASTVRVVYLQPALVYAHADCVFVYNGAYLLLRCMYIQAASLYYITALWFAKDYHNAHNPVIIRGGVSRLIVQEEQRVNVCVRTYTCVFTCLHGCRVFVCLYSYTPASMCTFVHSFAYCEWYPFCVVCWCLYSLCMGEG